MPSSVFNLSTSTHTFPLTRPSRAVACGRNHTVAITSRDVFTFGANESGQLGLESSCEHEGAAAGSPGSTVVPLLQQSWHPVAVPSLRGVTVTQVVCGRAHTIIVTAQSQVRQDS